MLVGFVKLKQFQQLRNRFQMSTTISSSSSSTTTTSTINSNNKEIINNNNNTEVEEQHRIDAENCVKSLTNVQEKLLQATKLANRTIPVKKQQQQQQQLFLYYIFKFLNI